MLDVVEVPRQQSDHALQMARLPLMPHHARVQHTQTARVLATRPDNDAEGEQ